MTGLKGRRAGATEYAPAGTSTGDVQSVQADGTLAYGPPAAAAADETFADPAFARQAFDNARALVASLTTSTTGITAAQAERIAFAAARQAFDDARAQFSSGTTSTLDTQQVAYAAQFFGG